MHYESALKTAQVHMSTVPTQEMSFTEGSIKPKHNKTQQDNETVEDFKSICRIHITLNIKKQRKTSCDSNRAA